MTTLEKIKAELVAFEEKKKEFTKELQKEFPSMFKELFEKSDKIQSFGWTQYTPFFNDGDTCEFGVHVDEPYINGEYIDECEWYSNGEYPELANDSSIDIEACKLVGEFIDIINSIPEEILKDLFGDHALVTIHKSGEIEVETYYHD
jgi:hypothetical protein